MRALRYATAAAILLAASVSTARADEVADTVIFLLSDAASLYTGQTLNPNAGAYMP